MKTLFCLFLFALLSTTAVSTMAQTTFHGAEATKPRYRVAYQLNSGDSLKILGTLRNINNALTDPRLKGKLDVELVVHGSGVAVYKKDSPYEKALANLQKQGVILAMCENTMRAEKLSPDALFPFVSYVPSGNGELIIREQDGWAIIHP